MDAADAACLTRTAAKVLLLLLKPPLFEKRGTKNFKLWAAAGSKAAGQMIKVSCFFFSKKKGFVS
ncbi:MAG: hypothetical protein Q4B50_08095, partial [Bacillota bacterium]|nr:hypothetical protein [Bacillota bacterium]